MGSIRLEHFYGVRLVLVSSREADRASIFIGSTDFGLLLGSLYLCGCTFDRFRRVRQQNIFGFLFLAVVAASVHDYDFAPASARMWWRNLLLVALVTPTIYYTGFSGAAFIPFPVDLANHLIREYTGEDLLQLLKARFRLY